MDDDIPYLLLTPGPLTTSRTVRSAMLRDYCTWDQDYNELVTRIRERLVSLVTRSLDVTSVLMQGSGTFCVEATLGSVVPPDGKVLIANNGAYGARMVKIAERLRIDHVELAQPEIEPTNIDRVRSLLAEDPAITHVALVHCETTTGMLNPAKEVGRLAREHGKVFILDAMSSFGGIPYTMEDFEVDYLVSSANKCIQGVPGFGFVLARHECLAATEGYARSLSLDLYDQWRDMEDHHGKWRFTSPTHTVRAFSQALDELDAEGGVEARHLRYQENHRVLVEGMRGLGFATLLPDEQQAPIITAFHYLDAPEFTFQGLYDQLKRRRFVIYPGKVSQAATFRIGNIGHVFPDDMRLLVESCREALDELNISPVLPG